MKRNSVYKQSVYSHEGLREKKEEKKILTLHGGVETFSPLCSILWFFSPQVLLGRLVKLPHAEFSVRLCYCFFFFLELPAVAVKVKEGPSLPYIINSNLSISVI